MLGRLVNLFLLFAACWAVYQLLLNPGQRREWRTMARQIALILLGVSLLALLVHLFALPDRAQAAMSFLSIWLQLLVEASATSRQPRMICFSRLAWHSISVLNG